MTSTGNILPLDLFQTLNHFIISVALAFSFTLLSRVDLLKFDIPILKQRLMRASNWFCVKFIFTALFTAFPKVLSFSFNNISQDNFEIVYTVLSSSIAGYIFPTCLISANATFLRSEERRVGKEC